jgi:hypothetical protein
MLGLKMESKNSKFVPLENIKPKRLFLPQIITSKTKEHE